MKKLTAIIILAVGVAVSAFAQDPNVTPAGISVPDFVTSLVTNFATSHPWLAAALVALSGLPGIDRPCGPFHGSVQGARPVRRIGVRAATFAGHVDDPVFGQAEIGDPAANVLSQ